MLLAKSVCGLLRVPKGAHLRTLKPRSVRTVATKQLRSSTKAFSAPFGVSSIRSYSTQGPTPSKDGLGTLFGTKDRIKCNIKLTMNLTDSKTPQVSFQPTSTHTPLDSSLNSIPVTQRRRPVAASLLRAIAGLKSSMSRPLERKFFFAAFLTMRAACFCVEFDRARCCEAIFYREHSEARATKEEVCVIVVNSLR